LKIVFILNNRTIEIEADPKARVVDILREDMSITGTKEGCGEGECGACTILVDGQSKLACLMLAPQLEGRYITTIEGLSIDSPWLMPVEGTGKFQISNFKFQIPDEDRSQEETRVSLHPIQEAFIAHGAVQCGFCTPGMVMAATSFLRENPNPDRAAIREALSGNLCRCTGYQKIVDAVEEVSKNPFTCIPVDKQKSTQNIPGVSGSRATVLPNALDELFGVIEEQPETVLYSGGTDLLVKLRNPSAYQHPSLICLERIGELKNIYRESNGNVFIGACATHSQLMSDPLIQQEFPILIKALKALGSPPVRNMGTIGGNICTASPAGDTIPPLYALDAEIEIRSRGQSRLIPIKDFISGPGKTVLKKGEILYGVWLKKNNDYNIQHFEKVGQRKALAISIASFTALIKTTEAGIIEKARFAWGSVGPTIITSGSVDQALTDKPLSEKTLKSLIPIIESAISPIDDMRASEAYRRKVAGNLVFRLLE